MPQILVGEHCRTNGMFYLICLDKYNSKILVITPFYICFSLIFEVYAMHFFYYNLLHIGYTHYIPCMREFLFTLLILHNCLALVIRSELPTYSPFYFFPSPHNLPFSSPSTAPPFLAISPPPLPLLHSPFPWLC